jgi:protein phosphatase
MHLLSAALTDIGRHRRQNQDRFICHDGLGLYGVADGIGGLPGGAEAAEQTILALVEEMAHSPARDPAAFAQLVQRVNSAVITLGRSLSPGVGIGTTLTCGIMQEQTCLLAHVGDSRCHLWRAGQLSTLTEDHSVENEMRRQGDLSGLSAQQRGALTRCIGQPDPPMVDVSRHQLQAGDSLLFTTYGICRVLGDARLADILGRRLPPAETLEVMVELANRRGGPDNATGVLVDVEADT